MSIKLLARELYRIQGEVERLKRALTVASRDKHDEIEVKLRKANAEKERLRLVLDGQLDR